MLADLSTDPTLVSVIDQVRSKRQCNSHIVDSPELTFNAQSVDIQKLYSSSHLQDVQTQKWHCFMCVVIEVVDIDGLIKLYNKREKKRLIVEWHALSLLYNVAMDCEYGRYVLNGTLYETWRGLDQWSAYSKQEAFEMRREQLLIDGYVYWINRVVLYKETYVFSSYACLVSCIKLTDGRPSIGKWK